MSISLNLPVEYWNALNISPKDLDFLNNHLFETETPKSTIELVAVLVDERIRIEREKQTREQKADGDLFLPKNKYKAGQKLVFPALGLRKGQVIAVREGINPEFGEFEVIDVELEDGGRKSFASGLEEHKLNDPVEEALSPQTDPETILANYGVALEKKLENALADDENLVKIAARWFPSALLIDINTGHLNLAEAVLEMSGGEPLSTSGLMEQIDLSSGGNQNLTEFSLNYALQEDGRFDEVGPAGEVLWCLRRLEPDDVQRVPARLEYNPLDYDRSILSEQMLALEAELDDELGETECTDEVLDEAVICLTYPHWRSGTLPISARVRNFFPTAYESPRIRFILVDSKTGQRIPAWVVRENGYVSGLREWYDANKLIPGARISIHRSEVPGEVIIDARTHRPGKDWVRTVLVGSDGGLVFSLLKQEVACEYDDRMVVAVPSVDGLDQAFDHFARSKRSFGRLVKEMLRELSKLTPQGHVHAEELYSAINILRRVPPAPLMAFLTSNEDFNHIGDLYFRLSEKIVEEE